MRGGVAVLADVAQLVDEVDEEEEGEEGDGDEDDRGRDVDVEEAADRPHAALRARGAVCAGPRRHGACRSRATRAGRARAANAPPWSDDERDADADPPGGDPGLRQVDEVVVRRRSRAARTAGSSCWRGAGSTPTCRCRAAAGWTRPRTRPRRQASSPWFGARRLRAAGRIVASARGGRPPTASRTPLARLRRGRSRSATACCSPLLCVLLVALALVAARGSGRRPRSRSCPTSADVTDSTRSVRRDDEDVAADRGVARAAFEEERALAVGRGLELARSDARQVGAALELVLQLAALRSFCHGQTNSDRTAISSSTGQLVRSTGRDEAR